MSARSRWIILTLAVVGLGFASYSAFVHYKLLTDVTYQSPCDINATFSCSQVYLSPQGSVLGVPVALWGLLFFGLVGVIALSSTPVPDKTKVSTAPGGSYLFALSTIGLAVVLYLAYTSWMVLHHLCVLCLGTYAATIGIFIVSAMSSTVPVRSLPLRMFSDANDALKEPLVLALLAVVLGSVGLAAVSFPKEGSVLTSQAAAPGDDFAAAWNRMPRTNLGIDPEGAKVLIVKFNDFQCPACGSTYSWYKPVLEQFAKTNPGEVRFVTKDWPWNSKCNVSMAPGSPPNHAGACEAAAAVRMARDQSPAKEVEMEEWLYGNQETMTADTVKAAAEKILGVTDFAKQYAQKLPGIQKDVADGMALHIQSTPTLFINGVRIDRQLMPASFFELAIQLELNKPDGK
jgi:uncharacterized membrane protein